MAREIKLSGGEITMLKAIGLGGSTLGGKMLIERSNLMEPAEFMDMLSGLMDMGYVLSNKVNVHNMVDVESAGFRVNPAHVQDLKEAIRPGRREKDKGNERRRRRG